jgi:peptidase E
LLLGVVVLIILWGIDLAFTTGFTHKLIEQRTEQQRISAALVDAAAVNTAQDELFELINAELKRLDMRIDSVDTFKVHAQQIWRRTLSTVTDMVRWVTRKCANYESPI